MLPDRPQSLHINSASQKASGKPSCHSLFARQASWEERSVLRRKEKVIKESCLNRAVMDDIFCK